MWIEENWLEHEMKPYGSTVQELSFSVQLFFFNNLEVHKTQGLSLW
jgi:hypothetical protein